MYGHYTYQIIHPRRPPCQPKADGQRNASVAGGEWDAGQGTGGPETGRHLQSHILHFRFL